MLDSNNGLVVHPNEEYGYVDDEPIALSDIPETPYKELQAAIENKKFDEVITLSDYDKTTRYITLTQIDSNGWYVGVATSKAVANKSMSKMIIGFVIAVIISLGIGISIITILINKLLRPLKEL